MIKTNKLTHQQQKKIKLKQILKIFPDKVPIWLYNSFDPTFNIGNIYVIQLKSSLLQFVNSIKAKLQYIGVTSSKNIFFYVKPSNSNKKGQMLTTFGQNMGELYDRYRGNEGWLDLMVGMQSTF